MTSCEKTTGCWWLGWIIIILNEAKITLALDKITGHLQEISMRSLRLYFGRYQIWRNMVIDWLSSGFKDTGYPIFELTHIGNLRVNRNLQETMHPRPKKNSGLMKTTTCAAALSGCQMIGTPLWTHKMVHFSVDHSKHVPFKLVSLKSRACRCILNNDKCPWNNALEYLETQF